MAPTVAAKKPAKAGGKKVVKKVNKVANRDLGSGVLRWSRFKIRQRKHYTLKNAEKIVKGKKAVSKRTKVAVTVTKPIKGANNGEKRVVRLQKSKKSYSTTPKVRYIEIESVQMSDNLDGSLLMVLSKSLN